MSTFQKAKAHFLSGAKNWPECRTTIHGSEMASITKVIATFTPFLLPAYGTLFAETERGAGWVTCINESGIRLEYFEGTAQGDHEWITADNFLGNLDATVRKLIAQPPPK